MLAWLVLAALAACLAAAVARPALLSAAGLVVLAVLWPIVNGPLEGPVLWVIAPGHGLALSDLVTFPCLIVGTWQLRGALKRRGSPPECHPHSSTVEDMH